jgi:hypothetical protein
MDWKQLLTYITGSVDQELLLRNESLATENRILRNQIPGRVRLSDGDRKTLAAIGKQLSKAGAAGNDEEHCSVWWPIGQVEGQALTTCPDACRMPHC